MKFTGLIYRFRPVRENNCLLGPWIQRLRSIRPALTIICPCVVGCSLPGTFASFVAFSGHYFSVIMRTTREHNGKRHHSIPMAHASDFGMKPVQGMTCCFY